jgi:hypothetical protein
MVSLKGSYYLHRAGYESYWVKDANSGRISQMALEILEPFFPLLVEEDVAYMKSPEACKSWFDYLPEHPIRLKSGMTGSGGYMVRN